MRILPPLKHAYKYSKQFFLRYSWIIIALIFIVFTMTLIGVMAFKTNEPEQPLTVKAIPAKLVVASTTAPQVDEALQSQTTTTTTTLPPPTTTRPQYVPQADWVTQCHLWASQAGITLTTDAIALIDKESDCNPTVKNPNSSACGIAQNINGCTGTYGYDPIQQLIWMQNYVNRRYGGWSQAWQFWNCIGYCRGINKTATWY